MERVWREAAAVSPDGLSDEDRITRDILQIVAEAAIEADDLAFHEMLAVDQINGPQTLLAQLSQFQPADTPERLDAWLARIRGYGAYIDAHIDIMADGLRSGRTAARIVADRTIEQISRMQAIPIERGDRPGDVEGGLRRRPGARPGRRRRGRLSGGPPAPRRAHGPVPRRDARAAGARLGARRRHPVPPCDPALDVARHGARGRPPGGPRGARVDQRGAAGHRRRRGLRHGPRRLPAQARHGPGEPGPDPGGARRALQRGHRAGGRGRADDVRAAAGGELRGPPGRGVQGARRAVRVLLPAVARPRRGPASTT